MDWIPILSQTKSFVQWASGDSEGAKQTQENFVRRWPIISQTTSLVQSVVLNDNAAAKDTQEKFLIYTGL